MEKNFDNTLTPMFGLPEVTLSIIWRVDLLKNIGEDSENFIFVTVEYMIVFPVAAGAYRELI